MLLLGALLGGLLATYSVLADNIWMLLFFSVIIASIAAGLSKKLLIGFIIYYLTWLISMYLHTVLFNSNAIMGLFAAVFYFPIIALIYIIVGAVIKYGIKK